MYNACFKDGPNHKIFRGTAIAFFKEENRPTVVKKLFKPKNSDEEQKIDKIMQNFRLILFAFSFKKFIFHI